MPGTPQPGRVTVVLIDAIPIGGIQDCNLALSRATIDVTDKDSGGWDEFIAGQGSLSLDGTCVYEEDDAGQEDLVDAIINATTDAYSFRPWGTGTGYDEWTCNGIVTSLSIDSPNKEALSFPFSIQLTGTPTLADQS